MMLIFQLQATIGKRTSFAGTLLMAKNIALIRVLRQHGGDIIAARKPVA
jgi:hypothetical protein